MSSPEFRARELMLFFLFIYGPIVLISWLAHKTCDPNEVVAYPFTDGKERLYKVGDDLLTYMETFDKHGCTP